MKAAAGPSGSERGTGRLTLALAGKSATENGKKRRASAAIVGVSSSTYLLLGRARKEGGFS